MSNVISLSEKRAEKLGASKANQGIKPISELVEEITSDLLTDWEKMVKKNRLNEFFKTTLSKDNDLNYLSDLNALSKIEQSIGLSSQIYAPGTILAKHLGWIVHFFIGAERVSTPELGFETYARAFSILLYMKLKVAARSAGHIF